MAKRKTVKARLDDRLLKEIPRFFGGWEPMLRELLQNCHRSKARNVNVLEDVAGLRLTIEDDGVGCPDPQLLLSAGATGWDEGEVTAPAGLGFFSALDPSIFTRVVVESYGWRLDIDPTKVLIEELTVLKAKKKRKGFAIVFYLKEEQRVEADLRSIRDYYTFKLTVNGKVMEPVPFVDANSVILETPVGTVTAFAKDSSHYSRSGYADAIWERRVIVTSWRFIVEHAGVAHDLLDSGKLFWEIDPASGVRPKLPDRASLDDNPQLKAAGKVIGQAFHRAALDQVGKQHEEWPSSFVKAPEIRMAPPWKTHAVTMAPAIFKHFGWRRAKADDLDVMAFSVCGDDGLDVTFEHDIHRWSRDGTLAAEHDLLTLLNLMEHGDHAERWHQTLKSAAVRQAGDGEKAVPVKVKGLQQTDKFSLVGLAKSITWDEYDLPLYLVDEGGYEEYGAAIIFAGTLRRAAAFFRDNSTLAECCLKSIVYRSHTSEFPLTAGFQDLPDTWWTREDEYSGWVNFHCVRDDLLKELMDNYGSQADEEAQEAINSANKLVATLANLKGKIPESSSTARSRCVRIDGDYFPATPELMDLADAAHVAFTDLRDAAQKHLDSLPVPPLEEPITETSARSVRRDLS